MTIVLGQLCVQILGFENAFALTESDITTALQIWPTSPRRCNWPLNGYVDDSNLDVYSRRLLGPIMIELVQAKGANAQRMPKSESSSVQVFTNRLWSASS